MKPNGLLPAVLGGTLILAPLMPCAAEPGGDSRPVGGLTLEACIAEALSENPALLALEAGRDATAGKRLTAQAWQNPELSLTPGWQRTKDSGSVSNQPYGEFELSQLIEFPGKRALRIGVAESSLAERELAIKAFRYQVKAKVRETFFQLLAAEKVTTVLEEQVKGARRFAESSRKRVEGGYASDFDVLKAEAELARAETAAAENVGNVEKLRLELTALLARPPAQEVEVDGDVEDARKHEPDGGDLQQRALNENFAYLAQRAEVERAGLAVKAARLARYPDVSVGPSAELHEDEQIYKFNFTLPLPLLTRHEGELQTAIAEERRARSELERLKLEISAAVATALKARETAERKLALYPPKLLRDLKGLAERAERGYASNTTPLLVFLDARKTYFETLVDYYESLAGLAEAQGRLDAALGGTPRVDEPSSDE